MRVESEIGGQNPMTEATERATSIDDLPVAISLEIDRKQISIEALSQLSKGKVMRFSDEAPDAVRVFANNKYFADATLIMVDDQVAVRIDKIR